MWNLKLLKVFYMLSDFESCLIAYTQIWVFFQKFPSILTKNHAILFKTENFKQFFERNSQGDKSEKTLQRIDMLNDVLTDISKSFFETVCQKPKDHKDVLAWRQTSDFKFFGQLEKSLEMFDSKYRGVFLKCRFSEYYLAVKHGHFGVSLVKTCSFRSFWV